jgi:hypothetical protein
MMNKLILGLISFVMCGNIFAQNKITDATITYEYTVTNAGDKPTLANLYNGATTTVYLKNNNQRTDQVTTLGKTATIYDGTTKTGVILKEFGAQKLLIKLAQADMAEINKTNNQVTFTNTTETKKILDYNCKKAIGKGADGTEFTVYYTNDVEVDNSLLNQNTQFSNLGGIPLEYELVVKGVKIVVSATNFSTSLVSPKVFEIPKNGYRQMTYAESKMPVQ